MRPSFHPRLVNDPFGDPGLFVQLAFENRAFIFDVGDIQSLSSGDLLKISAVFITHTHMDHLIGFDHLLRLMLGRDKHLKIYGPPGIQRNIEGKLTGYAWNLVENYQQSLVLSVTEVTQRCCRTRAYRCRQGFRPETLELGPRGPTDLLCEPALTVRTALLDHGIPCLAYRLEERFHVNIRKDRLAELGMSPGPWLRRFKNALYSGADPRGEFAVPAESLQGQPRSYSLGALAEKIAIISEGQKIAYITDVGFSGANVTKILALADSVDHLFIEGTFSERHRDVARRKYHLTAWQAGRIAAQAKVKRFTLFHFSPRYTGRPNRLYEEARQGFCSICGSDDAPLAV